MKGVLVGKKAPDFTAQAVMADNSIIEIKFSELVKGKKSVLFFYPLDFTFVCPTEIIALNNQLNEFRSRGVEVILISIDSQFSHLAWKNTPLNKGGIGKISVPMVSDISKSISRDYDVLTESQTVSYRGTFVIDAKGIVRHQSINDLPIGREISEIVRIIDALSFYEEHGEVCPANWRKGERGMKATQDGVVDYLTSKADSL